MAKVAIFFGALLIAIGVGAFFYFDKGKTPLIPAYFGAPILLCGVLALKESIRMHAMHGAVLVALIGFLMPAAMVVIALTKWMGGAEPRWFAVGLQSILAAICGVFVVLCVRSFIAARKRRQAQGAA